MKILLFGVSQVGKSTVAKIIAKKLNYAFYDIDYILIDDFGSVERFQSIYKNREKRYNYKADLVNKLCKENENVVIPVSPIFSYEIVQKIVSNKEYKCFNLTANAKTIFDRMGFYDEKGILLEDSFSYKYEHKEEYMRKIVYENTANSDEFRGIKRINTSKLKAEEVADLIIKKVFEK